MIEIERKFLCDADAIYTIRKQAHAVYRIQQGYLQIEPEVTRRVRIRELISFSPQFSYDPKREVTAFFTMKRGSGIAREEYEVEIPLLHARDLLDRCGSCVLNKTRYLVHHAPEIVAEIDVFTGRHKGLVLCEFELPYADHPLEVPAWCHTEVTESRQYSNAYLSTL